MFGKCFWKVAAVVDEIPVKKARCVFDGGCVDDGMGLSAITSVVKKVRTATTTVNNAICSKYFANKGSKTRFPIYISIYCIRQGGQSNFVTGVLLEAGMP